MIKPRQKLRLEEWLNNPDSRSDAFRARPTLPQIQPSLTRLHQADDRPQRHHDD